jgi:hypothetical protein
MCEPLRERGGSEFVLVHRGLDASELYRSEALRHSGQDLHQYNDLLAPTAYTGWPPGSGRLAYLMLRGQTAAVVTAGNGAGRWAGCRGGVVAARSASPFGTSARWPSIRRTTRYSWFGECWAVALSGPHDEAFVRIQNWTDRSRTFMAFVLATGWQHYRRLAALPPHLSHRRRAGAHEISPAERPAAWRPPRSRRLAGRSPTARPLRGLPEQVVARATSRLLCGCHSSRAANDLPMATTLSKCMGTVGVGLGWAVPCSSSFALNASWLSPSTRGDARAGWSPAMARWRSEQRTCAWPTSTPEATHCSYWLS